MSKHFYILLFLTLFTCSKVFSQRNIALDRQHFAVLNTEIDSCMDIFFSKLKINTSDKLFLLKINDLHSNGSIDFTISQVFLKSTIIRSLLDYDSYYTYKNSVFLMLNVDGHRSHSPNLSCFKSRKDSALIFQFVFNDLDSNKSNSMFAPTIDAHFTITSEGEVRRIYSQIDQVPTEKAAILYLKELE